MEAQIFVMTHKAFTPPPDKMYVPLQVGRACHEPLGFLGDACGDNISAQNAYFSELTGVYWLWKNLHHADVVGVCHYRRYLIAEDGHLYTKADIERLLEAHDMVVTKKLELRMPYYDGFAATHDEKDLVETERVVAEKYPAYAPLFHEMVHKKETYFGNMMVCRKALFDRYCAWLFDILFEVQRRIDTGGYDNYRKRVYGFLSEFLLTVWIAKNGLHVYESRVGMSAEKYETGEIKRALAAYFAKKDIAGAKRYLLRELEKRPDVLMEASDIGGGLKLCMQIIATCEHEARRGERSFLDGGMSFEEMLAQMESLNRFAAGLDGDGQREKAAAYLAAHPAASETAMEIAGVVAAGRQPGWLQ